LQTAGVSYSAREIARGIAVSDGYLEQLFIPLRKDGLIQGIRGPQGGYTLGRPAGEISAGQILRAVEGGLLPTSCVLPQACPEEAHCISRKTWSTLYKEMNACVDAINLSDMVAAYNDDNESEYAI
jgi:Rrf2 family protein